MSYTSALKNSKKKNKIVAKQLRYFPVSPMLQRLFMMEVRMLNIEFEGIQQNLERGRHLIPDVDFSEDF